MINFMFCHNVSDTGCLPCSLKNYMLAVEQLRMGNVH